MARTPPLTRILPPCQAGGSGEQAIPLWHKGSFLHVNIREPLAGSSPSASACLLSFPVRPARPGLILSLDHWTGEDGAQGS